MAKSADPGIIKEIRRFASDPTHVWPTRQAKSDMLAHGLTTEDVCDTIIDWIDARERVKLTTIHSVPGFVGMPAYEMKPRINGVLFYIKVVLMELESENERMLLFSVHPDHSY